MDKATKSKLAEIIVVALLPQLKLDITKPEETVKNVLDLYKTIEKNIEKETHIEPTIKFI
ncbi:MAG: hypothetical protein ACLPVI_06030 [Dehalococcoidales bacterium]